MIHDFTKGIAVTSYTKCKFASYPLDSVDKAYQKARSILNFDATAKVTVWQDGKAIAEFGAIVQSCQRQSRSGKN